MQGDEEMRWEEKTERRKEMNETWGIQKTRLPSCQEQGGFGKVELCASS